MLFRCKNCGGNMIYDPAGGKMLCPHCDSIDSEETEKGNHASECVNCGAALTVSEFNSTCKCEYCSSYIILDERVNGEYRPRYVLPFKLGKKQVVDALQLEFKTRIFTPGSFLSESTLEKMNGMYIPFWLYDYKVNCDYAGKGTKIRVWRTGDTEYTETSYYRVVRNMDVDFDKIPVDASNGMEDGIMDLMEPYNYQLLEGFQEKYMSGFFGEIYNEDADTLEERAMAKVEDNVNALLHESMTEYRTMTPEHKDINADREAADFALLPVWKYQYKYENKEYDFYVNGQTGKIYGSTPVSRKKVLAFGSTVFAAACIAFSLVIRILEVL